MLYDHPNENAKILLLKQLKASDEYDVCDVSVYESMRFRPSTRTRKNSVFKIIRFSKRFRMLAFRVT